MRILRQVRTTIGDHPMLAAEILTIQEAIKIVARINIDNIILKSHSQVTIDSIADKIVATK